MNDLTTYNNFFKKVIDTINSTRYETFKALNKFNIEHNYEIGKLIVENQEKIIGKNLLSHIIKRH